MFFLFFFSILKSASGFISAPFCSFMHVFANTGFNQENQFNTKKQKKVQICFASSLKTEIICVLGDIACWSRCQLHFCH